MSYPAKRFTSSTINLRSQSPRSVSGLVGGLRLRNSMMIGRRPLCAVDPLREQSTLVPQHALQDRTLAGAGITDNAKSFTRLEKRVVVVRLTLAFQGERDEDVVGFQLNVVARGDLEVLRSLGDLIDAWNSRTIDRGCVFSEEPRRMKEDGTREVATKAVDVGLGAFAHARDDGSSQESNDAEKDPRRVGEQPIKHVDEGPIEHRRHFLLGSRRVC